MDHTVPFGTKNHPKQALSPCHSTLGSALARGQDKKETGGCSPWVKNFLPDKAKSIKKVGVYDDPAPRCSERVMGRVAPTNSKSMLALCEV
jgi:hypothetical protein